VLTGNQYLNFKNKLTNLCLHGHYYEIQLELRRFLPRFSSKLEYVETANLLGSIPHIVYKKNFTLAKFYAVFLHRAEKTNLLEEFIENHRTDLPIADLAILQLEMAMALQKNNQHFEASLLFQQILGLLNGESLGIAYANLGWAFFETQKPWEAAFSNSFVLLRGLELARAKITYGYCAAQAGMDVQAKAAWLEALPLTKKRTSTKSHVLYNLAAISQKNLEMDAESYWIELERITRNPQFTDLHSFAMLGIALQRRNFGEWFRAEKSYIEAKKYATKTDLLISYYWGLARVYLLSNCPEKALEILEQALQHPDLTKNQLYAAKASVLLALNDLNGTRENLLLAGDITLDSVRWLLAFTKAELARREHRESDALLYLENLPVHTLHAREEAGRHPQLCALLEKNGLPAPMPLPYCHTLTVRVEATDFLMVYINNRIVNLPPTGKAAELLIFLLEHDFKTSASELEMNLYLESDDAHKRLGELAKRLEKILGWAGSVKYDKTSKEFKLDSNVTWQYDIAEARATKFFHGEFLKGMKPAPDWVLKIREELAGLKP
jgi:hypothetical protein